MSAVRDFLLKVAPVVGKVGVHTVEGTADLCVEAAGLSKVAWTAAMAERDRIKHRRELVKKLYQQECQAEAHKAQSRPISAPTPPSSRPVAQVSAPRQAEVSENDRTQRLYRTVLKDGSVVLTNSQGQIVEEKSPSINHLGKPVLATR